MRDAPREVLGWERFGAATRELATLIAGAAPRHRLTSARAGLSGMLQAFGMAVPRRSRKCVTRRVRRCAPPWRGSGSTGPRRSGPPSRPTPPTPDRLAAPRRTPRLDSSGGGTHGADGSGKCQRPVRRSPPNSRRSHAHSRHRLAGRDAVLG